MKKRKTISDLEYFYSALKTHERNLKGYLLKGKPTTKHKAPMKNNTPIIGCGASSGILKRFQPPYHLFFKASCARHDAGYNAGGTPLDRWYCDVRFYNAMRYDVKKRIYKGWFKRQYYLIWCKIYFLAVRLFGSNYFNYTK